MRWRPTTRRRGNRSWSRAPALPGRWRIEPDRAAVPPPDGPTGLQLRPEQRPPTRKAITRSTRRTGWSKPAAPSSWSPATAQQNAAGARKRPGDALWTRGRQPASDRQAQSGHLHRYRRAGRRRCRGRAATPGRENGQTWHHIGSTTVAADGTFTLPHTFIVPGDANIRVLVAARDATCQAART